MSRTRLRPMYNSYNKVLYKLKSFLSTHFEISTDKCDVFEETLLYAAGITTQPEVCKFAPMIESHRTLELIYKNITQEDADKFLHFLKQYDERASYQYLDQADELNKVAQAYHFKVDTKIVYQKILPDFE